MRSRTESALKNLPPRSRNRISAQESPPALKKPNPRSTIFSCAQETELALKNLPPRSRNRIRAQQFSLALKKPN
ncbi:hypothetical protein NSQ43_00005 [Sporosarcina sp. FSL W8-0480]|uniref:hypothetical protein n=1 Tax=Sporosarcina sp. FSL W8-0480 TaxID=2954701 RepID=UPI0030D9AE03